MGGAVGWIAIKGMGQDDIVKVVGMMPAPDAPKPQASICRLPSGWTLLFTLDFGFPTPERMAALSADGSALAVSADDRSMGSVVRGYESGEAVFAIEHDGGSEGVRHIATAGTIPAAWASILAEANRQQDEEDATEAEVDFVYDAPMTLAAALCGYRHDQDWPEGEEPEATLLMPQKRPGLLGRLFGR